MRFRSYKGHCPLSDGYQTYTEFRNLILIRCFDKWLTHTQILPTCISDICTNRQDQISRPILKRFWVLFWLQSLQNIEYKYMYHYDNQPHESCKWPTWRTITLYYNTFITVLYMFLTTSCSSSGGQIVLIQHLV